VPSRRSFLAVTAAALAARRLPRLHATDPGWRARKRTVQVRGLPLAYVASARPSNPAAPTIVFLHGNPTSSYLWRRILPGLETFGWCVAPDLLGMGDSARLPDSGPGRYRFVEHRDYLEGLLDALAPTGPVCLVLHDWGGMLGFDWARRHPDRVAGIAHMETVMDGLDRRTAPPEAVRFFERYRTPEGAALVLEQNQFVEQVLIGSLGDRLTEADRAEYRRPFLAPGEARRPTLTWPTEVPLDGAPADVAAIMAACHAWLAESMVPKLFVNVEPGALVAAPGRKARCRGWPATTEVVLPGRHFIQEEAPVELQAALAVWLETLTQGRR